MPWIGARQLAFVKKEWDANAVPVDTECLTHHSEAAAQLASVVPTSVFNHMVLQKSSDLGKIKPQAAI